MAAPYLFLEDAHRALGEAARSAEKLPGLRMQYTDFDGLSARLGS